MKVVVNEQSKLDERSVREIFDNFDSVGRVIYSGRNVVRMVDTPSGVLAVKRFKVPHLLQKFVYTLFCHPKAQKAYDAVALISNAGVGSPAAVAYGIGKRYGFVHTTYFACEYFTCPTAAEIVYNKDRPTHNLVKAIAQMAIRLHKAGVMHGDLNLTNILVKNSGQELTLSLVDTNRTRLHVNPSRSRCLNNLVRLTHNRQVLAAIAVEYARARGWNPELTVASLNKRLDKRERAAERKRRLKKVLSALGLRKK